MKKADKPITIISTPTIISGKTNDAGAKLLLRKAAPDSINMAGTR